MLYSRNFAFPLEDNMKNRLCAACLALLIGFSSANLLLACGDKFLVASRGTRFQKAPVKREPHAILIWANPSSEVPNGLAGVAVDETLRKAGYQSTTMSTPAKFENALKRDGWNLLVLGFADAQAVSKRLQNNSPAVLPVAVNPTDSQMKQARMEYEVVLRGPVKKGLFLNAVDEALAHRSKKNAG
jgi:hypothetical protein